MGLEKLRLTAAECRHLAELCETRSRWGPAGASAAAASPAASGPPPRPSHHRSAWLRTWHFRDRAAAERWNGAWEAALEGGAVPPFLLAENDERLQAEVARIAAGVLLEEVEGGGLYPTALAGGRYELRVEHVYHTSPLAWARSTLVLALDGRIFDGDGNLLWALEAAREYPFDQLSEGVAQRLADRRWAPGEREV